MLIVSQLTTVFFGSITAITVCLQKQFPEVEDVNPEVEDS
jgi:hypothetical protein